MVHNIAIVPLDKESDLVLKKSEELNLLLSDLNCAIVDNDNILASVPIKLEISEELLEFNKVNLVDIRTNEKETIRLNMSAVNLTENTCKPELPMTKRDIVACILKHHSEDKYLYLP